MAKRYEPKALELGWYTTKEVLRLSECEITTPVSFDVFGHAIPDGLYDSRMGPIEKDTLCGTCHEPDLRCPGHFGHVRLARPVLNPLLYDAVVGLLRAMCHGCESFKMTDHERLVTYTRLRALQRGVVLRDAEAYVRERSVEEVEAAINGTEGEGVAREDVRYEIAGEFLRRHGAKMKCPRCDARAPRLQRGNNMRVLRQRCGNEVVETMAPEEVRRLVDALYANEGVLLEELFGTREGGMFFVEVLPVIPNRLRPPRYRDGRAYENSVNTQLARIMQYSMAVEGDARSVPDLQAFVQFYFDSARAPGSAFGLKQILEKKEGVFRKNIMGKRVNYAARTVISPDPNLHTREIGVPLVFAQALTFPERVTAFNVDRLRRNVRNGPAYPGCAFVESDGALVDTAHISSGARHAMARQLGDGRKVVWRHLLDGDAVLVNRQPTLHAVGLMAHTVRVLRNEKTLRMHYVNCKPYNADFDGDEMNIHLPQSLHALAECHQVAHNDQNYFVPASGKPIRGLEQDHVVAAAVLTLKDSFFTRDEYFAIVSSAIDCIDGCNMSGIRYKQVDYKCKGKGNGSGSKVNGSDGKVNNYNDTVNDKHSNVDDTINNTSLNNTHSIPKYNQPTSHPKRFHVLQPCICSPIQLYSGKQIVSTVLRNLGVAINYTGKAKITNANEHAAASNKYNGMHLFSEDSEATLRIRNGVLLSGTLDKNSVGATSFSLIHACGEVYGYPFCNDLLTAISRMVNAYIGIKGLSVRLDDLLMDHAADSQRRAIFSGANQAAIREAQAATDPRAANDQAAVDARMINFMNNCTSQAVALLGHGLLKKGTSNNMGNIVTTGAKGSMVNFSQIACALGQQELEGRRVPFMASAKTLPCFVAHEPAPAAGGYVFERFLTGVNPATFYFHCMAGREGLIDTAVKTANSGYLQRCLIKHLEGIKVDYDGCVRADSSIIQYTYGDDGLDCTKDTYLHNVQFYADNMKLFKSGMKGMEGYNGMSDMNGMNNMKGINSINDNINQTLNESIDHTIDHSIDNSTDRNTNQDTTHPPTSTPKQQNNTPTHQFQSHSHSTDNAFNHILKTLLTDATPSHVQLMKQRFEAARVDPGKSVGIIAAQSIGEPSTQMTLNTFHLAGVGGRNVTLGIPRLREILMVASKSIKTPVITVPITGPADPSIFEAFTRTTVADCLHRVVLSETYARKNEQYMKSIKITFEFSKAAEECAGAIDTAFLKMLAKEIKRKSTAVGIIEHHAAESNPIEATEDAPPNDSESSEESNASIDINGPKIEKDNDNTHNNASHDPAHGFLENLGDELDEEPAEEQRTFINLTRISNTKYAFEIFYPADFNALLMPIIEAITHRIVVRHVPGINRAFLSGDALVLEGSNFLSLIHEYNGVWLPAIADIHRSYSNDIYAVYQAFGVEAARAVIVKEIIAVFDVYGININIRHLFLVADYMTRAGRFAPFNRSTFTMNDSFIQKMSFESCFTNLKNSALFHQRETVSNPSACITVGNRIKQGTGACSLLYNLAMLGE